ncbi:MAG: endonuclease/exonuclease/phosphatase family protein, partial [Myxococcota bacterium]
AEDDTAAPGTSASPTTDAVADSESGSPQCPGDPACAETVLRFATWNTLRVGPVGSAEYEALLAIVLRLDADVLCLQEVGEGEEPQLQALATAAGYHDGILTPASGPPGIGIANACMSRLDTLDAAYLWSDWISSDATARDLTRPFVRLRIRDDATGRYVSVLSGHLKAGTDDVDRFRRMVEFIRLGQAATAERDDFPGNAVVVLGDFNETPNPQSSTFSSLPSDLPSFYNLGNDIALPLTYAPAEPLQAAGLTRVEARWEDGTEEDTFIPFANRLDYIYVSDEEVLASEVYEACRDDGIDAEPVGDVLDKVGAPLDCGLSEVASDHRPVIVELVLR